MMSLTLHLCCWEWQGATSIGVATRAVCKNAKRAIAPASIGLQPLLVTKPVTAEAATAADGLLLVQRIIKVTMHVTMFATCCA